MTIKAHNLASLQQQQPEDDDATMAQMIDTIDAALAAIERVREDVSERVARCIVAIAEEREARIIDTSEREARHIAMVVAEREARAADAAVREARYNEAREAYAADAVARETRHAAAIAAIVEERAHHVAAITVVLEEREARHIAMVVAEREARAADAAVREARYNEAREAYAADAVARETRHAAAIAVEREARAADAAEMVNLRAESNNLRERLIVVEGRHNEVIRSVDRVAAQASAASTRIDEVGSALRSETVATAQLLEQVRTLANRSLATDAATQQIELLVNQSRDLSVRSVAAGAEIVELGRRMTSIHSSAPKRVSIDRAGDLILISGDGDVTTVGRVCGQDGTSVVSADTSTGRLMFLLTDGSRIDVGPWPPVSAVPALTAAAPETALDDVLRPIAKKMHEDGIPILKIRTMLGIGRPRLMRLLNVPA